jgi:hypothetical protein
MLRKILRPQKKKEVKGGKLHNKFIACSYPTSYYYDYNQIEEDKISGTYSTHEIKGKGHLIVSDINWSIILKQILREY